MTEKRERGSSSRIEDDYPAGLYPRRGEYRPPEYIAYMERAAAALKTVRIIAYSGMVAFIILAAYGFFLIYQLTTDAHRMTEHMGSMRGTMSRMQGSMVAMDSSMKNMDPMLVYLYGMNQQLASMTRQVTAVNHSVQNIANSVSLIQHSARNLDRSFGPMMGMFNSPMSMMPFFGGGGNRGYQGSPPAVTPPVFLPPADVIAPTPPALPPPSVLRGAIDAQKQAALQASQPQFRVPQQQYRQQFLQQQYPQRQQYPQQQAPQWQHYPQQQAPQWPYPPQAVPPQFQQRQFAPQPFGQAPLPGGAIPQAPNAGWQPQFGPGFSPQPYWARPMFVPHPQPPVLQQPRSLPPQAYPQFGQAPAGQPGRQNVPPAASQPGNPSAAQPAAAQNPASGPLRLSPLISMFGPDPARH
jgi:hypothetical protein